MNEANSFSTASYTLKIKVLYETSKKGSVDVEKLPNVSKVWKKE